MEAVELRKNQLAVLLVLGSCGLRWLPEFFEEKKDWSKS